MTTKRICFISDTHLLHDDVNIPACDVLVHSGDCLNSGKSIEFAIFLHWFSNLSQVKHKILVAGNHDWVFQLDSTYVKSELKNYPDITYLQDNGCIRDGIYFYGSPWQPAFCNWAFNVERLALKPFWDKIPNDVDVLITHGPPRGILDVSPYDDGHLGCEFLRNRVEKIQPLVHSFGHIHHGYGSEVIGNTIFINASICNEQYEPVNSPILVEFTIRGAITKAEVLR